MLQLPLHAQVKSSGKEEVIVVRPAVVVLDAKEVRRQLSAPPKVVVVPVPAPATKTTTIVTTPGKPTRVYNAERNVLGLMPHPERASEAILGNTDGLHLFHAMRTHLAGAA